MDMQAGVFVDLSMNMFQWNTNLAYSWGYGDEYHVVISYFPNSIQGGNLP